MVRLALGVDAAAMDYPNCASIFLTSRVFSIRRIKNCGFNNHAFSLMPTTFSGKHLCSSCQQCQMLYSGKHLCSSCQQCVPNVIPKAPSTQNACHLVDDWLNMRVRVGNAANSSCELLFNRDNATLRKLFDLEVESTTRGLAVRQGSRCKPTPQKYQLNSKAKKYESSK